jgi:hypothetical protein
MPIKLSERIPADLPDNVRETLRKYVKEAAGIFGDTLDGMILYGSAARGEFLTGRSNLNLIILLAQHDLTRLQRYANCHRRWSSERLVVPLFLTEPEIQISHKLFPLEYVEIKHDHVLLMGHDPFPSLLIDQGNLAMQCAREITSNLMRLRQRFVEGSGKSQALAILLPLSLTTLLPCLRGQYHLRGLPLPSSTDTLLSDVPLRFGFDATVLQEVWNLKKGIVTPGPIEMPRLYERYVASLQTLSDWSARQSMSPRL